MAPALQISIPKTSTATPSDGSKQYTVYHVQLQLPLRLHQVQKRYTDFLQLHQALLNETPNSAAPPAPLPPKSWLRRTVNNASLTEDRRRGLEAYVRGIVEAEDARWRSSAAWRNFLNLPNSGAAAAAAGGAGAGAGAEGSNGAAKRPLTAAGAAGGGGIRDSNEWLEVHRSLKSQIQSARSQLKQRDAATVAQQQHSLSAEAKASLVRSAAAIAQLDDWLKSASANNAGGDGGGSSWGSGPKLGAGEIRRRRDLISAAKNEVEGLESVLKSMATRSSTSTSAAPPNAPAAATQGDRDALWKGTAAATKTSGRVLGGGPLKETERTREKDNAGVLQLQQQIMQEQDEDVMELGKTVAKLKDMGILINEELEVQNEMLGLVEGDVERVQGKLDVAKRRIGKIK